MRKFLLACLIFGLSVTLVRAEVWINELNSYPSSGDWIELYADTETDISGWILRDSTSEIKTIPPATKIGTPSASHQIIYVSNRLNRSEDLIELFQSDGNTLVNSVSYGYEDAICAAGDGQTLGRLPDGSSSWIRLATSTPATSNTGEEVPCPSPSPSPTPTPQPQTDPPRADTPTPSPSIKPSPPAPSVVISEVESLPGGTVAGTSAAEIDLSGFGIFPSPSPSLQGQSLKALTLNRTRAKTAILVGSGLILISLAGFLGYRQYLRTQETSDL